MSGVPYLDIEFSKLNVAQRRAREEWMANEANRLIEARGRIERPAKPVVWNQVHNPSEASPSPEQLQNDDMARQLIRAMAGRDRSNGNA